jgi:hypothetical protein
MDILGFMIVKLLLLAVAAFVMNAIHGFFSIPKERDSQQSGQYKPKS